MPTMPRIDLIKYTGLAGIACMPLLLLFMRDANETFSLVPAVLFILYTCILAIAYRVLDKISGPLFVVCSLILVLFSAVNSAYLYQTHFQLNYEAISSAYETNVHELSEFLSSEFFKRYLLLILAIISASVILYTVKSSNAFFKRRLSLGYRKIAILMLGIIGSLSIMGFKYDLKQYYPLRELDMNKQYLSQIYAVVREYRSLEYSFQGDINRHAANNIVLVIGEAARKGMLGIYGCKDDTTPYMQQIMSRHERNIVLFDEAISASPITRVSVPSILSVAPAKDFVDIAKFPSILKIVGAAGYRVTVAANQGGKGFYNRLAAVFLDDAAQKSYTKDVGRSYDEELLPIFFKQMSDDHAANRLLIVHFQGSHYKYSARYPENKAYFTPDSRENEYKNSIRYTDYVLAKIVNKVFDEDKPYALLYVSDHGEYLNELGDGIYGHGFTELMRKDELEIPFIFIFNDKFLELNRSAVEILKKNKHKRISHDNISHTLLGLSGVRDKFYQEEYDLSSSHFREKNRFVLDTNANIDRYDTIVFRK